jgi:hypothetical protein
MSTLPADFQGKELVKKWYLNTMVLSSSCVLLSHLPVNLCVCVLLSVCLPLFNFTYDRLGKLESMRASEELTEDDGRQMVFDLEKAYNEFNRSLQH